MKPIRKASLGRLGSSETLCLLKRGDCELVSVALLYGTSEEGRKEVSNRREMSLSVTRRGRSLDD